MAVNSEGVEGKINLWSELKTNKKLYWVLDQTTVVETEKNTEAITIVTEGNLRQKKRAIKTWLWKFLASMLVDDKLDYIMCLNIILRRIEEKRSDLEEIWYL